MKKTTAQPQLETVLEANKRKAKLEINCVKIGVIEEFDKDTQLATIQISHKQVVDVKDDGSEVIKDYPILLECPVVVLFGGVDVLTMPIEQGDNCLVLFNDRDIDNWLNNGNGKVPITARLHDISDAFALVGIRPLTNSITNYLSNGIRLSHNGGDSQIDLKDGLIESVASLFLHTGNMQINGNLEVNGNLTVNGTITATDGSGSIELNSHTHSGVKSGSANTGGPNAV